MEEKKLLLELTNMVIPAFKDMLDECRSFEYFFKKIKRIIFIEDCEIKSELEPNNDTNNHHYLHQNILQIEYASRTILFDLNEGGLLDEDFEVVKETGLPQILFAISEENSPSIYEISELETVFMVINNLNGNLKNLHIQFKTRDEETFKNILKTKYNVIFENEDCYILNEDPICKMFVNIDLNGRQAELSGVVSFLKNDEYQKPIVINDELQKLEKLENCNVEEVPNELG